MCARTDRADSPLAADRQEAARSNPRCIGIRGRKRQFGQALAETLVIGMVAVPLIVLVVLLGKYQSVRSATVAASRSLAFDCAMRPQLCPGGAAAPELMQGVRQRHFSADARAPVSGAITTQPPRLWTDRTGRQLVDPASDLASELALERFDAGVGTAVGRAAAPDAATGSASEGGLVAGAAAVLDRLAGPARFGLQIDGGLVDARVRTDIASRIGTAAGFAALEPMRLSVHARTAVLTGSWNASGREGGATSIAARAEAGARLDTLREARITAGYLPVRSALSLMGAVGLESHAAQFRFHQIDPAVVPPDRLGSP